MLWRELKQYIIRRDGYKCVMCGKSPSGLNLSHFYPQHAYSKLRYNEDNVCLMCSFPCHLSTWHKDILTSAEWYKEHIDKKQQQRLNKLVKNYESLEKPDREHLFEGYSKKLL